ncbi:MAG TPA: hypothetical protein PLV04_02490 [Phenylobacterium sp.]|uniref:Uncharacterized protein n=1 Tax=Phenylobacterium conjunctum TaxID=1298959 RepID=A0ABW3T3J9_9CAUL|nr:hypothetical protein [Phenylobacterium sp.]HQN49591.1 hypothetical protein [Phenylobacterium sp.]HQP19672.1 hypothetical protein [Phenylobacterium sp.]
MVQRAYVGLADPLREFEALRPYADQLRALQRRCKPFGRDYNAIAIALDGLETAAYHFTRRPHFYAVDT